jgi:hypothetical protein
MQMRVRPPHHRLQGALEIVERSFLEAPESAAKPAAWFREGSL